MVGVGRGSPAPPSDQEQTPVGLAPSPTPKDQLDSGRPARRPCSLHSPGQRLAQGGQLARQGDQVPRPHTGSTGPLGQAPPETDLATPGPGPWKGGGGGWVRGELNPAPQKSHHPLTCGPGPAEGVVGQGRGVAPGPRPLEGGFSSIFKASSSWVPDQPQPRPGQGSEGWGLSRGAEGLDTRGGLAREEAADKGSGSMRAGVLERRGFREGLAQAGQESEKGRRGGPGRTQAGRRGGPGDKGGGLSRSEQKQPSQEEGLERSLWGEQGLEGGARLPQGGQLHGEGWREGPLLRGGPLRRALQGEEGAGASPGRGCCWDDCRKGKPCGASVRENGREAG